MSTRREFLQEAFSAAALLGGLGPGACAREVEQPAASAQGAAPGSRDFAFAGRGAGERREIEGLQVRWCPAGRFIMGSPPQEPGRRPDEAQVEVTLTRGFWMGAFEVTQGDWTRLVGAFPDRPPTPEFGRGPDFPVYWVSFTEAEYFCRSATERAQRTGDLPEGWEIRIPTEAEWEYACRAGTLGPTAFGERMGRHQANFLGEESGADGEPPPARRAVAVGGYPANPWGIHDMHGNIFEWCRDWYHTRLPGGRDPDLYHLQGVPNGDGSYSRVRRGGAWNDPAWACRSACRLRYEPHRRSDHIGFRIVAAQGLIGASIVAPPPPPAGLTSDF